MHLVTVPFFLTLIERAAHTQRDSLGGSMWRGQRTFRPGNIRRTDILVILSLAQYTPKSVSTVCVCLPGTPRSQLTVRRLLVFKRATHRGREKGVMWRGWDGPGTSAEVIWRLVLVQNSHSSCSLMPIKAGACCLWQHVAVCMARATIDCRFLRGYVSRTLATAATPAPDVTFAYSRVTDETAWDVTRSPTVSDKNWPQLATTFVGTTHCLSALFTDRISGKGSCLILFIGIS